MDKVKFELDVASALELGRREAQEDAIAAEFPVGDGHGIVVVADGMGGHAAGDVASRIVVETVFSELASARSLTRSAPWEIPAILQRAANDANEALRLRLEADPSVEGMGSTLLALVQRGDAIYWVSIGDSVLYLFRNGQLRRLNEDHSLVPQIEMMVSVGLLTPEAGQNHVYRQCLTSALTGDGISQMDCPDQPLILKGGDIVVAASDGLQFLAPQTTQTLLAEYVDRPSPEIAQALLQAISDLDDPQQDNVCFTVVKVDERPAIWSAFHGEPSEARLPIGANAANLAADLMSLGAVRRLGRTLLRHLNGPI